MGARVVPRFAAQVNVNTEQRKFDLDRLALVVFPAWNYLVWRRRRTLGAVCAIAIVSLAGVRGVWIQYCDVTRTVTRRFAK